jgi:D-glycero-alpha-D-manno-heptose-7-phosphate kinase|tara:strand:- start:1616 stop:2665 length:1050 start_codon:yes stop_codon:yes gene_type:complete
MKVRAMAPLRLGLAGGGTDVSPYCDIHGGYVLNATIDKYAYATLEKLEGSRVEFNATCQDQEWGGAAEPFLESDGDLDLYKGVYNRVVRDFNQGIALPLKISTFSDAPPGSGLGSSSTLVVAILQCFVEYLNLPLGEYEIAQLAYDIERRDMGLSGGKQDQYAATFGGFNFIEFGADNHVLVNPLRIKPWIVSEIESSLVLYFTGVSRSSANIIEEQMNSVGVSEKEANGVQSTSLDAMHQVKRQTVRMKEYLLRGEMEGFAEAMNTGWTAKKGTSASISNNRLDEIYEAAIKAGALSGKVSGAGGGGFMMFLVDPPKRARVEQVLRSFGGDIMNCHFTSIGAHSWRIQ